MSNGKPYNMIYPLRNNENAMRINRARNLVNIATWQRGVTDGTSDYQTEDSWFEPHQFHLFIFCDLIKPVINSPTVMALWNVK